MILWNVNSFENDLTWKDDKKINKNWGQNFSRIENTILAGSFLLVWLKRA